MGNKCTTGLLIIDMQPKYDTSKDILTRNNVIIQVEKAKRQNRPIFIVEYQGRTSRTTSAILKHLKTYKYVYYIKKYDDDGGREVMQKVIEKGLNIKHFITCGVNISYCIAETVGTLMRVYRKKITIIKEACNCEHKKERAFRGCFGNINTVTVFKHPLMTLE